MEEFINKIIISLSWRGVSGREL